MTSFRIYVPTQNAEDWKRYLAEPEKHWRSGYSARALAYCWQAAHNNFPPEVKRIFAKSDISGFSKIEPLLAIVEHKVTMPGKGKPSQNDLFVLAKVTDMFIAIVVEGKVNETFGATLQEWNTGSENRGERLKGLQTLIGLPITIPPIIRYQLIHRMASAVVEAKRFNAAYAIMLIHSFGNNTTNFDDFRAFVALYGKDTITDALITLGQIDGINLLTAWVHGNPDFLST